MNILLVVLDALSALHLPQYGYKRQTFPCTSSLIEEEFTVFERAYSPSFWTPPAHASLFSGLYPHEHGVGEELPFFFPKILTIQHVAFAHGLHPVGITTNPIVTFSTGFARGFSDFIEIDKWDLFQQDFTGFKLNFLKKERGRLDWLTGEKGQVIIVEWFLSHLWRRLKKNILRNVLKFSYPYTKKAFRSALELLKDDERNYFIFINIMETHHNYNPPVKFRGKWSKRIKEFKKWERISPRNHYTKGKFPDEVIEHLKDLYDEEILALDEELTAFLQGLKDSGRYDDSLIIITSDHGEAFGEEGHLEHMSLVDPVIRIPMFIKLPGQRKGDYSTRLVQLNDIFALVSEVLNSDLPVPASSISPLSSERKSALSEIVDFEAHVKHVNVKGFEFQKYREIR